MCTIVGCNSTTNPAPIFIAPVASHVIAAWYFVDWWATMRALCNARIYIVHHKPSFSWNLAGSLMVRISTLEASRETAWTDGSTLAAAARPTNYILAAGSCAPLKRLWFADAHILLNDVVLLLNLGRAESLNLLQRVVLLAPLLHAGQLHSLTVGDFSS